MLGIIRAILIAFLIFVIVRGVKLLWNAIFPPEKKEKGPEIHTYRQQKPKVEEVKNTDDTVDVEFEDIPDKKNSVNN